MKYIRQIGLSSVAMIIALYALFQSDRAMSAGLFLNNGAKISVARKTYISLDSLKMRIDNAGVVNFAKNSYVKSNCDIVISSGIVAVRDTTTIITSKNIFNFSNFGNYSSALTIVKGNFKNAGSVYNESIIELGE